MIDYRKRIVTDPSIMLGKPVIKGTRITVEVILSKMGEGATVEQLIQSYPHISQEDIMASLCYSADVIGREELLAS